MWFEIWHALFVIRTQLGVNERVPEVRNEEPRVHVQVLAENFWNVLTKEVNETVMIALG